MAGPHRDVRLRSLFLAVEVLVLHEEWAWEFTKKLGITIRKKEIVIARWKRLEKRGISLEARYKASADTIMSIRPFTWTQFDGLTQCSLLVRKTNYSGGPGII